MAALDRATLYKPDEKVGGIIILTEDITERKQTQDKLRRFELLGEHSRGIILFIRATDGRIMEANAAAFRAYGHEPDELLGLSVYDLRAEKSRQY